MTMRRVIMVVIRRMVKMIVMMMIVMMMPLTRTDKDTGIVRFVNRNMWKAVRFKKSTK